MKFKNILVVLNPDNEKQYALARAVRLVKEQENVDKVKIPDASRRLRFILRNVRPAFFRRTRRNA